MGSHCSPTSPAPPAGSRHCLTGVAGLAANAAALIVAAVALLAVAPTTTDAASSACVSTVFGYESLQTGFDLETDVAPPLTQTCIALDGAAVRHGFLVTYSGGLTSCCVERGIYTAGDCALTCSSTSTDIFFYDTACFHRCYDVPTDVCVDAPLFVGNPAPPASIGIQALDTNLPLNQAPQKTYLLNTGNAYASVYALDLGTTQRRRRDTGDAVLYCAGRGTTVFDTQSGAATGCVTNPCLPPLANGFVYAGAACYFSCFQPSACAPGYSGVTCDQVVDNCAFTQCLNGGTCTNVIGDGTYTCTCVDGYSGNNCEAAPVNGCSTSPCQNGGTCTPLNTSGAYQCNCTAQFNGTSCETPVVNACTASSNLCRNNGTCNPVGTSSFYCTCPPQASSATSATLSTRASPRPAPTAAPATPRPTATRRTRTAPTATPATSAAPARSSTTATLTRPAGTAAAAPRPTPALCAPARRATAARRARTLSTRA